jgi:hypothetical protein
MGIKDLFKWKICKKCGKSFASIFHEICSECRNKPETVTPIEEKKPRKVKAIYMDINNQAVKVWDESWVTMKGLNPYQKNELEKAMSSRGIDYDTIQLITSDFEGKMDNLQSVYDARGLRAAYSESFSPIEPCLDVEERRESDEGDRR